MRTSTVAQSLLLTATGVAAAGRYCSWPIQRTISSVEPIWTAPELVAGVFVGPSSTTGTISSGYTFTKSWTITGGVTGSASLPGIGSLGVSASYGTTTAQGTSLTVSVSCPANVRCGIMASTYVLKVTGTETLFSCGSPDKYDTTFPCRDSAPKQCPNTVWGVTPGQTKPFTAVSIPPFPPLSSIPTYLDHWDANRTAAPRSISRLPRANPTSTSCSPSTTMPARPARPTRAYSLAPATKERNERESGPKITGMLASSEDGGGFTRLLPRICPSSKRSWWIIFNNRLAVHSCLHLGKHDGDTLFGQAACCL
ncbi:hypothetical protein RB601_008347 [Gaeumannomyces tritici]